MAVVGIETTELEVLLEASLTDSRIGMQILNFVRIKNSKTAYPANYHEGDLNHYQQNRIATAAGSVQAALEA